MAEFDSLVGQQIDHYQVIEQIGEGGMAAVYLARDLTLDRQVVLKTLLPALSKNEDLMRRFEREAKATARLEHPNIVPVYTTSKTPSGQPYIAMQYIEGGSLSDHLDRLSEQKKWISAIYALSIVRQIADALHIAHQAGIVHRDLKPSNILLRNDGTPVLADLGIAAVQQATTRLTQSGSIVGTPNYMSPEQGAGQDIDGRSDLYSLGIILDEMLSGQLPFDADSPWAMRGP
jgi:serine/threonine protein kinase